MGERHSPADGIRSMKYRLARAVAVLIICATLLAPQPSPAADPTRTGPETEKRFPPLKLPPGFKATLFACDPLVEYPSVACAGAKAGSIFVAIDYVAGLGSPITRKSEIRLVEDVDGDGYADKATVYAAGFNSIQGLAFHDGTVFAMHAPFLTSLRDTNADGVADVRRDLFDGLGLPPEKNPSRLHCANGVVVGHDGWLYLAIGDNGCEVPRPEGDRLIYKGGGILRCRPDGHDLHVFATGLRNIYDIAHDEDLNVFLRDNENDGGDYLIRVYHSFFGADHGYPYKYAERPEEALAPLGIFGRGSSAGGLCYLETGFPAEYRGNLFFCEWGRSIVRYRLEPRGSGFAPVEQIEFASGGENDPYGFKPTDLVAQSDGSLIVTDWADGQQPKRGRGRIYRITAEGNAGKARASAVGDNDFDGWLETLDSESYAARVDAQTHIERMGAAIVPRVRSALQSRNLPLRGRMHAVWMLAHLAGDSAIGTLLTLARSDPDVRVQVQAIRAVADLTDPVLVNHRLTTEPCVPAYAVALGGLASGADPRVVREVVIALGRMRWVLPEWLRKKLVKPDEELLHAAVQYLRRAEGDAWPEVLALLDAPNSEPVRPLALQAIGDRYEPAVVNGLIARLESDRDPAHRRQYADALTRLYKKPGPWVYWGYRPAPRPANTLAWEPTEAIEAALDRLLADPDAAVRLAALKRMLREKIPTHLTTLDRWLRTTHDSESTRLILEALNTHPTAARRPLLAAVIADRSHSPPDRLQALSLWVGAGEDTAQPSLVELATSLEDGPVLAQALQMVKMEVSPKLRDLL
jgi:putative membrane-bound dehydrogenase-like protein